jgi:hypothetical protein
MNNILKFSDYQNWQEIAYNFLNDIDSGVLHESGEENHLSDIIKSILNKFGFNMSLVLTFGTGVKLMYPIVFKLIENMELEIKPSQEDIVLLCITMLSIIYLENNRTPPIPAEDIKNKLNAEVQMKFGNPRILIDKLLKCFQSIFLFIKKFPKLFGVALNSIIEMFAYTAILQPVMNAISSLVGTYHITPENLSGNLISLATGVATISGKTILDFITNHTKNKSTKDTILSDVEDLGHIDSDGNKLIKEQ